MPYYYVFGFAVVLMLVALFAVMGIATSIIPATIFSAAAIWAFIFATIVIVGIVGGIIGIFKWLCMHDCGFGTFCILVGFPFFIVVGCFLFHLSQSGELANFNLINSLLQIVRVYLPI